MPAPSASGDRRDTSTSRVTAQDSLPQQRLPGGNRRRRENPSTRHPRGVRSRCPGRPCGR